MMISNCWFKAVGVTLNEGSCLERRASSLLTSLAVILSPFTVRITLLSGSAGLEAPEQPEVKEKRDTSIKKTILLFIFIPSPPLEVTLSPRRYAPKSKILKGGTGS